MTYEEAMAEATLPKCERCQFYRANAYQETLADKLDKDPRPYATTLKQKWREIFHPDEFKRPLSRAGEMISSMTEYRNHTGSCRKNGNNRQFQVNPNDHCGSFEKKLAAERLNIF